MADNKNIGIKNLPQVGEIKEGDFLLVEAEAGTSILDFKDFVIGDDNTTQAAQISSLQTDVDGISSIVDSVSGSINPVKTDVATISADIKKGINQIVSTVKRDTFSITSNETDWFVIPTLSAAITPTKTNSVIRIDISVGFGCSTATTVGFKVVKNAYDTFIKADDASSRQGITFRDGNDNAAHMDYPSFTCIDHPGSTDEQVYGLAFSCHNTSDIHINRAATDSDASGLDNSRTVSTFTVMEIITG
jgi:hypothetical protein